MMVRTLPRHVALAPLQARLRFFAELMQDQPGSAQLVSDLEEAAVEIDLGQTTRLTYRGGKGAR